MCMCIWHTCLCEFAIGVQCTFVFFVCVFDLTFAFHIAACLCVSIINGVAKHVSVEMCTVILTHCSVVHIVHSTHN